MMRLLLREPLLHFFILGVALFALYGWLNDGVLKAPNEIVVSRGQYLSLQQQFQRTWQRPPTSEEMQGLVDGWVRRKSSIAKDSRLGWIGTIRSYGAG